jgi:hypothetical protein
MDQERDNRPARRLFVVLAVCLLYGLGSVAILIARDELASPWRQIVFGAGFLAIS